MTNPTDSPSKPQIPPETPQNPILDYLTEYFTLHPERQQVVLSFIVLYTLPGLTASLIKDLRQKGRTYGELSALFGYNLGRSTIQKIENGLFFPKKPLKQLELLKKVLELI